MQSKILVVDDEPDVVELVGFNLRVEGYKVESTETGMTGLNKARSVLPDLIILDLMTMIPYSDNAVQPASYKLSASNAPR